MAASTLRTAITPGSGTITDAMGNAHTVTAGGVAQVNGANGKTQHGATVGGGTVGHAVVTNGYYLHPGDVYLKDAMGNWSHFDYAKGAFVMPGPPPGGMT